MTPVDCFFDFISPYAYLQAEYLARHPLSRPVRWRPVLFAGLLDRWGQLGPAEIAPKRRFTYRYCVWQAQQLGIAMRMPPAHPFNPLKLLRLAIALDSQAAACLTIFRFVFRDGRSTDNPQDWERLTSSLGLADADARIAQPAVKEQLRQNGEDAIACGVFGVPTLVVDNELFWGVDATKMCVDYLNGAAIFRDPEMARIDQLPQAAQRPR